MSGDVQPRKRKDKKRKKEDSIEEVIQQVLPPTVIPTDDVNIHVHKESSTGGGICAKFVFFILLTILAVLIGLIITEHRGLTDLDAANTESRYSQIFDGWTDESPLHDDHDDEIVEHSKEIGSHEEEEEEENDVEHSKEDEHEEDEEHESDEETQSAISEEEEDDQVSELEETVERTEEDEDDVTPEYEEETAEEETLEDNDGEDASEKNTDEETVEETYEQESEETADDDDEEVEEQEPADDDDDEEEQTIEKYEEDSKEEEQEEADLDGDKASEEDQEVEDVDESIKQASEEEAGNIQETDDNAEEEEEEEEHGHTTEIPNNSGDKVKEQVAQENEVTEEIVPDLSRRNTIVVPPSLDQVQQELESEEDYSEEEDEDEEDEEVESEEESKFIPSAKRQYQELRNVYTRTLTPEEEYDKSAEVEDYDDEQEEIEYEPEPQDDDEDEPEEEEDDDDEDEEELDDKDLLKRLEAKYGKIRHSDEEEDNDDNKDVEDDEDDYDDYEKLKPWKRNDNKEIDSDDELHSKSGAQSYHSTNITNVDDWDIRQDLDDAQDHLPNRPADALSLFNKILEIHPHSPRALYGKAKCLDILAEKKQSNKILHESIDFYLKVINTSKVPELLFKIAADRCINRMRFIGHYGRAVFVHKLLIEKFPNIPEYPNQLAVTYLTINKVKEAKMLLYDVLSKWPNDGFALVHYGFILKTNDNNINDAIYYLKKGINSKAAGVLDGRFYFHLGDALTRVGREDEAYELYEDGVLNNVFLSKYQRSLYNVNRLTGKPWWDVLDLPLQYQKFFVLLKENWKNIRDEGLAALNRKNTFKDEAENLRDVGDWKQFELYARSIKYLQNCQKCPKTCKIIDTFSDAAKCRRGQVKFSVMEPGTHVWPHCGPTNCRLRLHLGLKVPPNTYIRVAEETRTWREGEIFIFDDSFEHEVWHNGSDFRLVLIVDIWHPELTINEKTSLSAI